MMTWAFWRNGALLLQSQSRNKFKIQVCYIQQCCVLNKENFVDNYESLAASAETEADGGSHESELSHFAPETLMLQKPAKSIPIKKPPLRQMLSHTNKMLFGPLLETSAEKRRRIKAEEDEKESTTRTRKHKKGKKKKPASIAQPLVCRPENAHLLGLLPSAEPKYIDKVQVRKLEIKQDSEMGDFSFTMTAVPKKKILVFKKSSKNSFKFDRSCLKDVVSAHKLDVASWNKERGVCVSPSTIGETLDKLDVSSGNPIQKKVSSCTSEYRPSEEDSQDNGDDSVSEHILGNNVNEHNCSGTTTLTCSSDVNEETPACTSPKVTSKSDTIACSSSDLRSDAITYSFSDLKVESDQELQALESNREMSSFLHVDNAKFSSAPSVIDVEMIENFPLGKTDVPGIPLKTNINVSNTSDSILTIGMFDGGYQRLPSVSKILEATMSEENRRILEKWKAKMIKELGEEGFEEYKKGLFDKGKLLHSCLHSELTGVSPGVENLSSIQGIWTSISHVLPNIASVSVLESRLVHPYLHYQGAVDCVATYKGMPVLIDWKTSTKPKLTLKSTFDNPLQVAAYLGALNYDSSYQLPHQVESAMVVVAYDSGLPAHVHFIDKEKCQVYWKLWCTRLVQFWRQLQVKKST